ncbi:MAG: DUF1552 domain-containing protein, partial [Planctomycetes bacterium]|nr:DUF1552 domain-containing protein [Planctomycetota bacterium]
MSQRRSRRAVLRGLGAAVALPSLASWRPVGAARAAEAATVPTRLLFLYVPNGVHMPDWRPAGEGGEFRPGPTLEPLADLRGEVQVITGLAHRNGMAGPDGAGDHARASATFLTGARPRKTAGTDIRAGISVDQVAAAAVGSQTRFPSLELSCDAARKSGNCDSGYSCAYQFNLSWRSERQPIAAESNPRLVFERLFGAGRGPERAGSL